MKRIHGEEGGRAMGTSLRRLDLSNTGGRRQIEADIWGKNFRGREYGGRKDPVAGASMYV